MGGIDSGRIEAMIAQLKSAASARPDALAPTALAGSATPAVETGAAKVNFADALKSSLDAVSANQEKAGALGKAFQMGDDRVSLSDVMIAGQKSSIEFQATIQVRNKLVQAYHEIMNMQV
jgi:flagellar hook-basal body complex protein FliE